MKTIAVNGKSVYISEGQERKWEIALRNGANVQVISNSAVNNPGIPRLAMIAVNGLYGLCRHEDVLDVIQKPQN